MINEQNLKLAFFLFPILLLHLVRKIYKFNTTKNSDIFQYKISNLPWTCFLVFLYLFTFGIILNILRFSAFYYLRINEKSIDLKNFFIPHFQYFTELFYSNLFLFFYLLINLFLLLLFLLFFFRMTVRYFIHQVISLHFYLYSSVNEPWMITTDLLEARKKKESLVIKKVYQLYDELNMRACPHNHDDLIRLILLQFVLNIRSAYLQYHNLPDKPQKNTFLWLINKIYYFIDRRGKVLFNFSPFFFFLFDCLFNNFVIDHFFYWMVFYIPISQIQRIMSFYANQQTTMIDLLYDIYWGNEECQNCYTFCVPKYLEGRFFTYIVNNCQYIPVKDLLPDIDFNFKFQISVFLFRFEYDFERDIYINAENIEISKNSDGKYFQVDNGEEWFFIGGNKEGYNPNQTKSKIL